jgi:uncharacterized protein with von Willebrand factor type A (vWA) domain|tara:strand:+ start:79 stop:225 length:147 start_codon:yes stop_codon:yes gene_type:complete
MKDIIKRIKKDALKITGGAFSNWYEGLSPIEKVAYGQTLRTKNVLFPL